MELIELFFTVEFDSPGTITGDCMLHLGGSPGIGMTNLIVSCAMSSLDCRLIIGGFVSISVEYLAMDALKHLIGVIFSGFTMIFLLTFFSKDFLRSKPAVTDFHMFSSTCVPNSVLHCIL